MKYPSCCHGGYFFYMKKTLTILTIIALLPAMLFAAGAKENPVDVISSLSQPTEINVGALKGPTAMGMVSLMNEAENGAVNGNEYAFSLEGSPDAIVPRLVKGELDIAAVPANLAAVLNMKTKGNIEVLAINTLGVLYIAENGDSVKSIEDIAGKTIYASGKGATPEYALMYVLDAYGLTDKVNVEWKSQHAEVVAALMADPDAVALIPQPFLTSAMLQNPSIHIVLDMNNLWYEKMGSVLITGVVAARRDFVEENEDAIRQFLADYEKSIAFTNENLKEASELVAKYGILPKAPVAMKAIPYCQITYIDGDEMASALDNYYGVLFGENPKSVGGVLPEDSIYFK